MKNDVQLGENLEVTAPYDVASGAACLVGKIFGVAVKTALSGARVNIVRRGVFTLPTDTGTAYTDGDALYWDNANKRLTKTTSGNQLVGAAVGAKSSGAALTTVLLDGTIRP